MGQDEVIKIVGGVVIVALIIALVISVNRSSEDSMDSAVGQAATGYGDVLDSVGDLAQAP